MLPWDLELWAVVQDPVGVQPGPDARRELHQGLLRGAGAHGKDAVQGAPLSIRQNQQRSTQTEDGGEGAVMVY